MTRTILVTGGAGFIGSNFLNLMVPAQPNYTFINLDNLTYAGNLMSLAEVEAAPNYIFEHGDIADTSALRTLFDKYRPSLVVHFAAETHVDRSLKGPAAFVQTNIVGTFNLLEACRAYWDNSKHCRFHHVSTDEVYGELDDEGAFTETTAYQPSSPYSASKASSDHLVRAYHRSYELPVTITNCSNNYGPRQFPEKLVPLMILNALEGKKLPVYGKGENVRDWLFVDDHSRAIWEVLTGGTLGETYNVGGNCELRNIDVVRMICDIVDRITAAPTARIENASHRAGSDGERTTRRDLIHFIADRPGHDYRYAMDTTKIKERLGWQPQETFESGLQKTVQWYLDNPEWIRAVQNGDYRQWIEQNYAQR